MNKYLLIFIFLSFNQTVGKNYPDKRFRSNINSPQEIMGREDRKYGDQSGNRVLVDFIIKGQLVIKVVVFQESIQ